MADGCHHNSDNNFLIGLVLGGVVGAGLTFLFTTKKGEEIREKIKATAPDLFDQLEDLTEAVEEKGEQLQEKAEEVKEMLKEELPDNPAVKKIEEKITEMQNQARTWVQAVNPAPVRKPRFFRHHPRPI